MKNKGNQMESTEMLQALKIIIATSIFFVWVVRYQNIIQEFKQYNLPNWLRDFVGICKLTCVVLILNTNPSLVLAGSIGLGTLMLFALIVHYRVNNPIPKMVPALTLLAFSVLIYLSTSAPETTRLALD